MSDDERDPDAGLIGVEARIRQLCGPGEQFLGKVLTDTTDDGAFFLVHRCWEHPEVDGAHVISERYAYLTRGDGSDGWVNRQDAAGINRRVPPGVDPSEFLRRLGQSQVEASVRVGTDRDPAESAMPRGE